MTRILGIETSCDETSAAVLDGQGDAVELKSLVILSQDVHRIFGGVVPEIASRAHLTAIQPVVEQALREAGAERLDAVAVTNAPGLVGALLVGVSYAKAFAFARGIPTIGVHHMEGHLFATALGHLGAVVRVAEDDMDAVTALSGSGPAYFALLAEAMIEAGLLLGLSRDVSTRLVVQTMFGSARLLRDENMHPVELREAVTSPGGTTTRAIRELEVSGVRAAFLNAINAATERSRELAERVPPE